MKVQFKYYLEEHSSVNSRKNQHANLALILEKREYKKNVTSK